jgi:hypothetical protein
MKLRISIECYAMQIQGKITYVDLAGGFWGIETAAGHRFEPSQPLPEVFRREGLRVEAEVEEEGLFSIYMWGSPARVIRIHAL